MAEKVIPQIKGCCNLCGTFLLLESNKEEDLSKIIAAVKEMGWKINIFTNELTCPQCIKEGK